MSKKKNDEEKEVKTEAQNQEDKKAETKEKENPLEKELKDTKDQLLRVTAEYSTFASAAKKKKMKASLLQQSKQFQKSLPRLIISKERLQMSKRITRDLKKVFK